MFANDSYCRETLKNAAWDHGSEDTDMVDLTHETKRIVAVTSKPTTINWAASDAIAMAVRANKTIVHPHDLDRFGRGKSCESSSTFSATNGFVHLGRHLERKGPMVASTAINKITIAGIVDKYGIPHRESRAFAES
jgi:hypothetical protein